MAAPNEWSLDRYRPYCRAIEKRNQFRGTSDDELVRWLQRILANCVKDKIDAARAEKRDIGRVQSLEQAVTDSHARPTISRS